MRSFQLSSLSTRFRSRPKRRTKRARGFSLVEMLVAVTIVGLLVGLVGPAAMRQLQSSRVKATEAQIAQLRSALDIFLIDTGRYPTAQEGLTALVQGGTLIPGWNGPYLRDGKLPADPWGGVYTYKNEGGQVRVTSFGADGRAGGTGLDSDITG
ncbi:type II secretion system major pseudopilin GspG [Litoreibacter roseus]|uniref:Type II secretion system core protein G n=1 Tax=Litoreibacter roseus TaxID=2601869 RepID=A0A6N6JJI7_9RHOB|nr:type II secretion system major pseudopilin GspG [Litoreibacter roseus]GFE66491.1 type II secretion system protein GspG [Litoreibacter roseus]